MIILEIVCACVSVCLSDSVYTSGLLLVSYPTLSAGRHFIRRKKRLPTRFASSSVISITIMIFMRPQ